MNTNIDNRHNNFVDFPKLTFKSQNVRSFNLSTINDTTEHKIQGITKRGADIIFLCDTRLNSTNNTAYVNNLTKKFFFLGYNFYHNSVSSNRGTAILISTKLDCVITRTLSDINGNFICLKCNINGKQLCIGCVYGPNLDENIAIFDELQESVANFNCESIILGGDWNCTWDCSNVESNIDVLDMISIPSKRRSEKLKKMCEQLALTDPFRTLYPNKKDYTYVPAVLHYTNRSRLDFFCISKNLVKHVANCTIDNALTSTVFDHKAIFLDFRTKAKLKKNMQIRASNIKNKFIRACVITSTVECYIHHSNIDHILTEHRKTVILRQIGSIITTLENINSMRIALTGDPENNALQAELEESNVNLDINLNDLPGTAWLESLNLTCGAEFFFEALCCAVREACLKQQNFNFKITTAYGDNLNKEINILKQTTPPDRNLINEKERQLATHNEQLLKNEVLERKKFELLHNEKITPYFLTLVKGSKKEDTLECITKDDGTEFESPGARNEFIKNSFESLYKIPDDETVLDNNSLNSFLGQVAQNPVVTGSKLTIEEKNSLEQELTIEELDNSVDKAKSKSAPGADGISNEFIKEYWIFFRKPLFRLAQHCYNNNTLTDPFRSAEIKLIPKKGDIKLLKNWRPISMLNCFYKIISRAVTLRLKKYMDKLTPVCQKGYSTSRRCQEVLLQLIENIDQCKKNNKNAALLSLDIKKAFDSIGHRFIDKVLDFFNFGPVMKKWLLLLCTNRKACIRLDNNETTSYFNLLRGNAQGDIVSPFLFLLGYQILLFKLQFDLQIIGTCDPVAELSPLLPASAQVSSMNSKALAMADDANILVKMDLNTLSTIKVILHDFGKLSGLCCNIEKTVLIPVGITEPISNEIIALGFEIKEKATILGMEISNNMMDFGGCAKKIAEKIKKEANWWNRFNLSLPGRINIAKSMLYSQVNYLGSFLPFTKEQINEFSIPIENFVNGNLRISKQRLYTSIKNGGLGLTKMGDFLNFQKCGWTSLIKSYDEKWKIDFLNGSKNNISQARGSDFPNNRILQAFAIALTSLRDSHMKQNQNYKDALIFNNNCLPLSHRPQTLIEENLFPEPQAKSITVRELLINNAFITKENLAILCGTMLTNDLYKKLKKAVTSWITKFKNDSAQQTSEKFVTFFNKFKRGSKIFKNCLTPVNEDYVPHNIVKYSKTTDSVIQIKQSIGLNTLWTENHFDNSTKSFIFKLHNNSLGYNLMVSKFVRGHSPLCTFCSINRNPEDERETPLHLFFQCEMVEPVIELVFRHFLGDDYRRMERKHYFGGFEFENNFKNFALLHVNILTKKFIWNCRNGRVIPTAEGCLSYIINKIRFFFSLSKKFRKWWEKCEINIVF